VDVLRFESVSKRFLLHREQPRSFQEWVLARFRRAPASEFWALRDVDFAVRQGETLGIVGENGSGKSTLLKLAAGIIRPTSGRVHVHGRVAALLELGAGFHPDLTGRENVYLNAAILGFTRREIAARFDAIVSFSELERFIDQPLKHYSSGMLVRLGFAVAIHSDPEVLIADEVLAVGDEHFQRKCIHRIDQFVREGRTIVLVSHSMALVRQLCTRAVWLDHGRVRAVGAADEVAAAYSEAMAQLDDTVQRVDARRWGSGEVTIDRVELLGSDGGARQLFHTGEPFTIRMHYRAKHRVERPVFGLAIHAGQTLLLTGPNTRHHRIDIPWVEGAGYVDFHVPALPLLHGDYAVSVSVYDWTLRHAYDHHDRAYRFHVESGPGVTVFGVLELLAGTWRHAIGSAQPTILGADGAQPVRSLVSTPPDGPRP
jgi:lipopolysaccharide transport system ATP-binding protein